jgi:hypothetical protein
VHTGEARIRDERFYAGPSIIRCARLRALGHGEQICCTRASAHPRRPAHFPPVRRARRYLKLSRRSSL